MPFHRTCMLLLVLAVATSQTFGLPLSCDQELIYVSMLGTRKHRLRGENPTVGVFYTTDFGDSWSHTGWKQGKTFATFAVGSGCGDTLLVAAGNGVMRSIDGGSSWRITTPWHVTEVQDVVMSNSGRGLAGTPYGILASDDRGASWFDLEVDLGSRSTPGAHFTSAVRIGRNGTEFAGTEEGLLRVSPAGWTEIEEPVRSIRQSPHDAATWMVGLQNGGVRLTRDNGEHWEPSAITVTIYEAEFHPALKNVLVAGGWQTGLLVSRDFGKTWERNETLPAESIHGIAISRRDPNVIIVGSMSDGVFVTADNGQTWSAAAPEIFAAGQIWDVTIAGE